jgi:putative membrane protein
MSFLHDSRALQKAHSALQTYHLTQGATMRYLISFLINAGVLFAMPYIIPAFKVANIQAALIAAVVIGLLNTIVRPILGILTLPITVLTLGLFLLVLNGFMFWIADKLIDGITIQNFGWAMVCALAYSVITWAVGAVLKPSK